MHIIKKNRAFVNLGLTPNRFKRRGDSFIFVTAHVLETQNLYYDARVLCHVSFLIAQEKLNHIHFLTSSNTTIATEMKETLAFSLLSRCRWNKKRTHPIRGEFFFHGIRQRPTLPSRLQPSTIGAERLNFCVRHGNRWIPFAIVTGNLIGFCVP